MYGAEERSLLYYNNDKKNIIVMPQESIAGEKTKINKNKNTFNHFSFIHSWFIEEISEHRVLVQLSEIRGILLQVHSHRRTSSVVLLGNIHFQLGRNKRHDPIVSFGKKKTQIFLIKHF